MLREFTDATGKPWRVWDVYPTMRGKLSTPALDEVVQSAAGSGAFPSRELSDGWLCFESGSEKRRLAPIPPEWEICGLLELEDLCAKAGYISRSGSQDATT